jgi:hypothetical protein
MTNLSANCARDDILETIAEYCQRITGPGALAP